MVSTLEVITAYLFFPVFGTAGGFFADNSG
jgi:hypothetical protein